MREIIKVATKKEERDDHDNGHLALVSPYCRHHRGPFSVASGTIGRGLSYFRPQSDRDSRRQNKKRCLSNRGRDMLLTESARFARWL